VEVFDAPVLGAVLEFASRLMQISERVATPVDDCWEETQGAGDGSSNISGGRIGPLSRNEGGANSTTGRGPANH
jgi:hypothetical protein